MARKLFKRWLPAPAEVKKNPALEFLGPLLHDPNLFHLNRHSVSGAVGLGLFVAFLPIFGQMPIAALLSLYFRVNLPISVALVWVSNPITIPPIFFATYELGRFILGTPPLEFSIELSWQWFTTELTHLWQPLLVGSLLTAVFFGGLGYVCMKIFWRWQVINNWERRKLKRSCKKPAVTDKGIDR